MDWELTPPAQDPTEIVSLQEVKDVLRINDDIQDDKITEQIKSAISLFEVKTGFILRAGTLKINFDANNLYRRNPRQKNYLANYTAGGGYFTPLLQKDNKDLKYGLSLGTTLSAQKPKLLSFNSSTESGIGFVELNQAELDALTDSFFLPISQKPLVFILKASELSDKNFNEDASNITIELTVRAPRDFSQAGDDIKRCIIRIVSKLFEFPDYDLSLVGDSVIMMTCQKYNYQAGL